MQSTIALAARLGAAATLSILASSTALAGGFKLSEYSVRDLGMANAGYAALADDPSTIWANPAGLTQLKGLQAQIGFHGIIGDGSFENNSSVDALGRPLQGIEEDDVFNDAVIPNLYVSKEINDRLTVGLAVIAPFGLATQLDNASLTRFQNVKSSLRVVDINPSLGYQLTERLSVGFGVSAQYSEATLANHVDLTAVCLNSVGQAGCANAGFLPGPVEAGVTVKGDDWAFGWNAGLFYQLNERTQFGLSYRSEIDHNLEGDATFETPANAAIFTPLFTDTPGSAALDLPAETAVSLRHQYNDRLALNASVVISWWDFDDLIVEFENPAQPASGEHLGYDTVARYAVGAEYQLTENWMIRGGVAFDETPTPDGSRTARVPDSDRTVLAIGASWTGLDNLQIDAGYQHLFFDDAEIDHVGGSGDRLVGEFDNMADLIGVSVTWRR